MFEIFRMKLNTQTKSLGAVYEKRLQVMKERTRNLSRYSPASYDAIVCLEGFSRVHNVEETIKECSRLLSANGILSFATFHKGTDFQKFFKELKEQLEEQHKFDELAPVYRAAMETYENLDNQLRALDKKDLEQYLHQAGFEIEVWKDVDYQGGCLLGKAIKKQTTKIHPTPTQQGIDSFSVPREAGTPLDMEKAPIEQVWDLLLNLQAQTTLSEDLKILIQDEKWETSADILDLGCGPGHFTAQLARYFPDKVFTGIEKESHYVESAHQKYGVCLLNLKFENRNILEMGPNKQYDFIILRFVAQHVSDADTLVETAKSMLRPGGRILFIEAFDGHDSKFSPRVKNLEALFQKVRTISGKGKLNRNILDHLKETTALRLVRSSRVFISSVGMGQKESFLNWFLAVGAVLLRTFKIDFDYRGFSEEFQKWNENPYSYGHWCLEYLILEK